MFLGGVSQIIGKHQVGVMPCGLHSALEGTARERERDVRVRVDDHHKRVTLDPSREEDEWIN